MEAETLVWFGDAVKASDDGKISGYILRWGRPDDADFDSEYFQKGAELGVEDGDPISVYYNHGIDPSVKNVKIGRVHVKFDDVGAWVEGQLDRANKYVDAVLRMAKNGRLGWSSGAVAHLVQRASTGKARAITAWPIGEASLTPEPADSRNIAIPIKSLATDVGLDETPETVKVPVEIELSVTQVPPTKTTASAMDPQDTSTTNITASDGTTVVTTPEPSGDSAPISLEDVKAAAEAAVKAFAENQKSAPNPAFNTTASPEFIKSLGDNEENAFEAYYRYGDTGGVKHLISGEAKDSRGQNAELITIAPAVKYMGFKASNATDMNIGTAADGGDLVPVDHFGQIIARRDESMITARLGVRQFVGNATSLDVPVDNEADGEFVTTSEAAAFDLDAPAVAKVTLTLVKKTKEIRISYELLQDEQSNLMGFLPEWVGRGLAKTHNADLVTEVNTNGSNLLTTASATVLASGELEDAVYSNDLGPYLDDTGSVGFVLPPLTYGKVIQLTGSERWYAETHQGSVAGPNTLGYPVIFSAKVEAYGTTTNKFALFGNFFYVGLYESPTMQVLRDPYSNAGTGQVSFWYYTRYDYGVLQAEGVGYIDHA